MHSCGGGAANSGFVGRHVTPDGNCFARGHNRAGAPREHAENCSKPLKICVFAVTESTGLQPQQDSRLDGARSTYDGSVSYRKSDQSDQDDGKCVLTNRDSFPEASFWRPCLVGPQRWRRWRRECGGRRRERVLRKRLRGGLDQITSENVPLLNSKRSFRIGDFSAEILMILEVRWMVPQHEESALYRRI